MTEIIEDTWVEVDSKGRTTIPKTIREVVGIDPEKGDKQKVKVGIIEVLEEEEGGDS